MVIPGRDGSGESRNCYRFVPVHYTVSTQSAMVPCLVVPNPFLADVGAAISTSTVNSISGRDSGSGFSSELRLSRICDLRTMVEVGFAQSTSAERMSAQAHGAPERNPTR